MKKKRNKEKEEEKRPTVIRSRCDNTLQLGPPVGKLPQIPIVTWKVNWVTLL